MLDTNGTLIMLGGNVKPLPVSMFALLFARKKLGGSLIGGIKETQEMLGTEVKHLLSFFDTTDEGATELLASE
jgi:D-arabinose 1-dehydrogenase-like Zn-dependent alcohol dehydrogenase